MKNLVLIILSAITLIVTTNAQQKSQNIDLEKIEEILNEYPTNKDPGISCSVIKDGVIIYKKNKGYANLEHMIAITDSTKFVVGSVSKQFTAYAITLLDDEDKLSIDDDIAQYLPELSGLEYKITIRHLLNHTSGFRNSDDLNSLRGKINEDLISQNSMVNLLLRQKELNFIPGSRFQYCNSGYVLLAEIVKRISGTSFAEFTEERIFKPLKMKNSLFLDNPYLLVKNKATSYQMENGVYRYIPFNHSIVGSTGLYTTVEDLCLWANNFDNPTIGNKSIFQKMETKGLLNNGDIIPYALGQELKTYKGLDVIFHGGGDGGFRTYLIRVPEHKLSIVISGNFEAFNPLKISYGLIDVFLAEYIKEPMKKALPNYTNKDLRKFEGDYQIFPGLFITILAEKDALYFKTIDSDEKLILPVLGENEFEFPYRAESKIRFFRDSLTWHFSDFYYPGNKVTLPTLDNVALNLDQYSGKFHSDEVETYYSFVLKNGKLIATHNFNPDSELIPLDQDTFISNEYYIGRIEFTRNNQGIINACKISGQKSNNVHFSKED